MKKLALVAVEFAVLFALLYFQHAGAALAPDVVVMQFAWNDVQDTQTHGGFRLTPYRTPRCLAGGEAPGFDFSMELIIGSPHVAYEVPAALKLAIAPASVMPSSRIWPSALSR